MNVPAYTSPTLCLGRTFDLETSRACADVFPSSSDLPIKPMNFNKFSFKYQVVKSSKDVNDLLDVSGELSLKIKANLLKVEGAGQYINESKLEEGTTSLLAVMKCTTRKWTSQLIHHPLCALIPTSFPSNTKSVTYGVEMVASLKFKSSSKSTKEQIKGSAEGQLKIGAVNAGLKASLDKLSAECNDVSDIAIKYYATDSPDKLPTTVEDLVLLIEKFPSRLKNLNDGKGIPISFELVPIKSIFPTAKVYLQQQASAYEIENLDSCFNDLQTTKGLVSNLMRRNQRLVVLLFLTFKVLRNPSR
ncbi:hypothetical protein pdam_00024831, partial [Pocillopora damicornis]